MSIFIYLTLFRSNLGQKFFGFLKELKQERFSEIYVFSAPQNTKLCIPRFYFKNFCFSLNKNLNPSESIEAFTKAIELIKFAKLPTDQKKNNIEELKINIKNADKIPQFSEEIVYDSSLDIIEEHSDLEGFSKKLGVKYTDDKGGVYLRGYSHFSYHVVTNSRPSYRGSPTSTISTSMVFQCMY